MCKGKRQSSNPSIPLIKKPAWLCMSVRPELRCLLITSIYRERQTKRDRDREESTLQVEQEILSPRNKADSDLKKTPQTLFWTPGEYRGAYYTHMHTFHTYINTQSHTYKHTAYSYTWQGAETSIILRSLKQETYMQAHVVLKHTEIYSNYLSHVPELNAVLGIAEAREGPLRAWVHLMQNSTDQMRNQTWRSKASCLACGLTRATTGSLTFQHIHDTSCINTHMLSLCAVPCTSDVT